MVENTKETKALKEEKWDDLTVEQIPWDKPKTVQGKLIEVQDTRMGVPFYVFTDDENKRFGVLGTTQLANYIKKNMVGNIFRIEYTGEIPTSDGENTIKNFKVKTRKP